MRPSIFFPFLAAAANAILLPNPTGQFGVAVRVHAMTDSSRVDPYSPESDRHKRKLVTSVFWPVEDSSCSTKHVAYMPPATAEWYGEQASAMGLSNDTFSALRLEPCSSGPKKRQYPLAIFSPGSGNSRLIHSAMAKSLAGEGYVVVTVDHPYDANIVEFPDGSVIESANIPEETGPLEKLTKVRAQDIAFVISQFKSASSQSSLLKGLPGQINFDRIVVWGHSLGGASSAAVMMSDSSIRAGVDLDGRFFEPVLSKGLSKPFFLLGRPNHNSEDATWAQFWKHLRGPKLEAEIAGTVHGSYTDLPLVMSALGLSDAVKKQLATQFGSIDPERMSKVLTKTVSSFFKSAFAGNPKKSHRFHSIKSRV
ncbi:Alpha/Beta hydrolase protein [Thelonectria olida]|uniref:1-alkyl-2-acetylglycerophosphocholine esterase n=1 Tax=Thelonectria olida TaxID=1576542 RepID=A0A9P9AQC9_9HYPO|nr:Alpha/Beta hydrolase protein [Thelonectria olida]